MAAPVHRYAAHNLHMCCMRLSLTVADGVRERDGKTNRETVHSRVPLRALIERIHENAPQTHTRTHTNKTVADILFGSSSQSSSPILVEVLFCTNISVTKHHNYRFIPNEPFLCLCVCECCLRQCPRAPHPPKIIRNHTHSSRSARHPIRIALSASHSIVSRQSERRITHTFISRRRVGRSSVFVFASRVLAHVSVCVGAL